VDKAPFIIHVKLQKTLAGGERLIDKFLKDDRYRSLFETGTGGGCTKVEKRIEWEDKCFGTAYKDAPAKERPKYGTVNLTNDPKGVANAARYYGKSFFVLKRSLRWRCSLTNKDSSMSNCISGLGGQEFMFLQSYIPDSEGKPDEIELILKHDGSKALTWYPEVQIHGQVKFGRDIAKLVADEEDCRDIRDKVQEFCDKHRIKLEWRSL
jgi:hypothetical protein